jgi:hypothetical protein
VDADGYDSLIVDNFGVPFLTLRPHHRVVWETIAEVEAIVASEGTIEGVHTLIIDGVRV